MTAAALFLALHGVQMFVYGSAAFFGGLVVVALLARIKEVLHD